MKLKSKDIGEIHELHKALHIVTKVAYTNGFCAIVMITRPDTVEAVPCAS